MGLAGNMGRQFTPGSGKAQRAEAKALAADAKRVSDEPPIVLTGSGAPAFDPEAHTVKEVVAYVASNPESASTVLANEKAGRKRKGVISALSG